MNGVTKEDLENNRASVKATIAKVLGVSPDVVNMDEITVNKDGHVCVNVKTPSTVTVPENIAELATPELNNIPGLPPVEAITSNSLS